MSKTIRIAVTGTAYLNYRDLVPFQGDLKTLSKENYRKLKKEILKLGFSEAISVWKTDGKYFILNGHQRQRTVQEMVEREGYSCPALPINLVEASSEQEAREKVLALTSQYGQIERQGLYEFSVSAGISPQEIEDSFRFPEIDIPSWREEFFDEPKDDEKADSVPAIPAIPVIPRTRPGDLFTLFNHVLLCGDATNLADVDRLMKNGRPASMVFTDPPYNLGSGTSLYAANAEPQCYGGLKASAWDRDFQIVRLFPSLLRVAPTDASYYICTSHLLAGHVWDWMATTLDFNSFVVWSKSNPMPSLSKRHWTWNCELIAYGTKGKHTFNFPDQGHAPSTWSIAKNQSNDLHPTQKPVALAEHAILHSSQPGDIVVDLFLGSGSTLIAADRTNRSCFGMEIDPGYCDVILDRYVELGGDSPIRHDGVPWSSLERPANPSV